MKTLKTQKGITLIALIITIIVMLILVGVSVNIALGNGLFKAAQSGARNTELEKQKETELSSGQVTIGGKTYSSVEDYVAGNPGVPTGVKVGDYVSYSQGGINTWRVGEIGENVVLYGIIPDLKSSVESSYQIFDFQYLNGFLDEDLASSADLISINKYLLSLTGYGLWVNPYGPENGESFRMDWTKEELENLGVCADFTASGLQQAYDDATDSHVPYIQFGEVWGIEYNEFNWLSLEKRHESVDPIEDCCAFIAVTLYDNVTFSGEGTASSPLTLSNS